MVSCVSMAVDGTRLVKFKLSRAAVVLGATIGLLFPPLLTRGLMNPVGMLSVRMGASLLLLPPRRRLFPGRFSFFESGPRETDRRSVSRDQSGTDNLVY